MLLLRPLAILLSLSQLSPTSTFHLRPPSSLRGRPIALLSSTPDDPSCPPSSSSLVPASSSSALSTSNALASAFENLSPTEQYSVTLTGLSEKILDDPSPSSSFSDIYSLLTEMSASKLPASPRALSSLLSAAAATTTASTVAASLSAIQRNLRGASVYGRYAVPTKIPRADANVVLPKDERSSEILSAITFLSTISFCVCLNALNSFNDAYDPTLPNLISSSLITFTLVDNFYNIFAKLSTLIPKLPTLPSLPEASPIGSGDITKTVVKGLSRLASSDGERECRVEASALLAGYRLGLPTFAFQATSLEAARALSDDDLSEIKELGGLLKLLTWLYAPMVLEEQRYPQMIASDPREADKLLERLAKLGLFAEVLSNARLSNEIKVHAYKNAQKLVRESAREIDSVGELLLSGGATVGDCITYLENWR